MDKMAKGKGSKRSDDSRLSSGDEKPKVAAEAVRRHKGMGVDAPAKSPRKRTKASPSKHRLIAAETPMAHLVGAQGNGCLDTNGSLVDLMLRAAQHPDQGIVFVELDGSEKRYSYADLLTLARRRLVGLRALGLSRGQLVPTVIQSNFDFIVTFWGCLLGGIVPAPLAYPNSFNSPNTGLSKVCEVWKQLGAPPILGDANFAEKLEDIQTMLPMAGARVLVAADIDGDDDGLHPSPGRGDELAFIQYSSGSTGSPKGVTLSHRNLLSNLEGIIMACDTPGGEVSVSWMPLSHDMGLIGMHLFPIANLGTVVNIAPHVFVRRPLLWLEKISEHRGNITTTPNFGCRLVLEKITPEHLARLDLSSMRLLFNGAEPIAVPVMREFTETLAAAKLRPEAMFPVYGMAEASLATTFPQPGSPAMVRSVHRRLLAEAGEVRFVAEDDPEAMLIADEGMPIPNTEVRIVDDRGRLVSELRVGHVQMRGSNVTRGYYNNPEVNRDTFDGDWLRTGDMGFVADGRLCITGRSKDVIIVDGQKFFAYDLEACVEDIPGVSAGKTVACGWHDHDVGRERVALFINVRGQEDVEAVLAEAYRKIGATFGISLDYIVRIKQVPRTTSGKLQRFHMRKAFMAGEFANVTYDAARLMEIVLRQEPARVDDASAAQAKPMYSLETLRRTVAEQWSAVLGYPAERIPSQQPFQAIGGTSVKAVQVLGLIEHAFGTALSHEFLLQCRTVEDMARYLERHLRKADHAVVEPAAVAAMAESGEDIAIVGMACRFPQADTPEAFWQHLVEGRDLIGEVPRDRWNTDLYYAPGAAQAGKSVSRWGGFIDAPYAFDAGFFNLSAEEAAIMDPQQRLFLQTSYHALDSAGYAGRSGDGARIGVFVGASHNNYMEHHLHHMDLLRLQQFESFGALAQTQKDALVHEWKRRFGDVEMHQNTAVDNLLNMIAARTSQMLNLKGPSLAIDTACSSSLVAVHLACDSLRRGECEMAIAGGVNLNLSPTSYLLFSRAGALSPTGRCRVFDASADGFVPGEGVGAVVLKPLSRALADGDRVLAVVKRSFVNNDGRSLGPMAPNPEGQRVAIASVYRDESLTPADIQYMEAHGTGTPIGDPSEMRSLTQVFRAHGAPAGSCVVGSVKANIGHLLSAAGIASLIKMVLALQHRTMPPSLHVQTPNPQIDLANSPFVVLDRSRAWETPTKGTRRGAINSFGFGGTNCHLVLEESPVPTKSETPAARPRHLFCVSAHSQPALAARVSDLAAHLQAHPELAPAEVAQALTFGRRHFRYRRCLVADGTQSLIEGLRDAATTKTTALAPAAAPRVALMFTGQGSQYPAMAARLYEGLPAFRRIVDECAAAFDPYLPKPLLTLLYDHQGDPRLLAQTQITQPVVFSIDYALGRLLMSWGVEPTCMLGHSVGEYAAACLAGVFSLQDAAKIVAARGRLMAELPEGGGMMAVFDKAETLAPMLETYEHRLWFGAFNGPHQVISGRSDALAQLQNELQAQGTVCKPLQVSHAFHTPLMAPMLDAFAKVLAEIEFHPPRIPLISNIGGEWMEGRALDAHYWAEHVLAPVGFEGSVRTALAQGVGVFVECGPDKVLTGLTRDVQRAAQRNNACENVREMRASSSVEPTPTLRILPVLDRRRDDWDTLLSAFAGLYEAGCDLDWRAFDHGAAPGAIAALPSYPFDATEHRILTADPDASPHGLIPDGRDLRAGSIALAHASKTVGDSSGLRTPAPAHAGGADVVAPPMSAQMSGPMPHAMARDWSQVLRELVAELSGRPANSIDMKRNFNDLGLDSSGAVAIAERLGEMTGERFPTTLLFEFQTPAVLAEHLRALNLPEPAAFVPRAAPVPVPAQAADAAVLREHDIAIVGMACRVPGADTPEDFWRLLMEGRSMVREVDPARFPIDDYFDPGSKQNHASYSKWAAFIERPYDFDPMFFGISPREAEAMDPQQRVFLQVAWDALQQSGYGGEFRTRDIGVFVGCELNHYGEHFIVYQRYQAVCERLSRTPAVQAMAEGDRRQMFDTLRDVMQPAELIPDAVAGQGLNEIAARVSHWLDLRGPNLSVNTACSSSMVALHLACQSLRNGESQIAIAGAAYLINSASPFVLLSRVGALSPTGECAPFDERANGMVLGEGVSAVVLKRMRDAVRDGDYIHAVIKGSAINNDGHSNGITAPNPRGQADVLRKAYADAGLSPESVSYIECHGTGTPLGDPVELDGMTQAFRDFTDRTQFCAIGSIKSSVGHMLSGSTLPGLIKTVMALQNGMVPPTRGFERPNPHVNFAGSPFKVVAGAPMPLRAKDGIPLRAGVNSFGFGGTNAHVVLEQAPSQARQAPDVGPHLILLSARNEPMLREMAKRLAQAIDDRPQHSAAQWCRSVNGSQRDLAFKAALRVRDREDLLAKLRLLSSGVAAAEGLALRRINPKQTPESVVVFDDHSPFGAIEAQALASAVPSFGEAYRACREAGDEPLSRIARAGDPEAERMLHVFATQYGAARMLMTAGTKPIAVLAEGVGILVGACVTGTLALAAAIDALFAGLRHPPGAAFDAGAQAISDAAATNGEKWRCPLLVMERGGGMQDVSGDAVRAVASWDAKIAFGANAWSALRRPQMLAIQLGGDTASAARLGITADDIWVELNPHASGLHDQGARVAGANSQDRDDSAHARVLGLFAQAYLHGLRFDPAPLASPGVSRVPLPAFPFENKPYRYKPAEFVLCDTRTSILPQPLVGLPTTSAAKPAAPVAMLQHPESESRGLDPIRTASTLSQAERETLSAQLREALFATVPS